MLSPKYVFLHSKMSFLAIGVVVVVKKMLPARCYYASKVCQVFFILLFLWGWWGGGGRAGNEKGYLVKRPSELEKSYKKYSRYPKSVFCYDYE